MTVINPNAVFAHCTRLGGIGQILNGCGCGSAGKTYVCTSPTSGVNECTLTPLGFRARKKYGDIQSCAECPNYEAPPEMPKVARPARTTRKSSAPPKEPRTVTQTLPSIPPARMSKGPPDRAEEKEFVPGNPPDRTVKKVKRIDPLERDLMVTGGTG